MRIFLKIILTLSFSFLNAKPVDIILDEKSTFPVILSDTHHNRVSLVDGPIEKIIANPLYFNIDINEKLGHAFITLKKPLEKAQALSIVTPSGSVQDLLISSADSEPIAIFIKEPKTREVGVDAKRSLVDAAMLASIFDGKDPEGFYRRKLCDNETISVPEELLYHIQKVDVLEGSLENLYLIHVKNIQRKPLKIHSTSLHTEKVTWVFAPKQELLKNEETTLVISREKD